MSKLAWFLFGLYLPLCVFFIIDPFWIVDLAFFITGDCDIEGHVNILIQRVAYSDIYYYLKIANCVLLFILVIIKSYFIGNKVSNKIIKDETGIIKKKD